MTGSNARLLSREMGSSLTGRYMPIELLPFSFKEYFHAIVPGNVPFQTNLPESRGKEMAVLDQYLIEGGYPESISNRAISHGYLSVLFDSVILKDVVKRFHVRYAQQIYDKAARKVYVVDNGFIRSRSRELSPDRGRLLENMVFIELIRRGYRPGLDLFYYKTRNGREVDFVCRREALPNRSSRFVTISANRKPSIEKFLH